MNQSHVIPINEEIIVPTINQIFPISQIGVRIILYIRPIAIRFNETIARIKRKHVIGITVKSPYTINDAWVGFGRLINIYPQVTHIGEHEYHHNYHEYVDCALLNNGVVHHPTNIDFKFINSSQGVDT